MLNWFFKDEFEQFYSIVEHLQKFMRIAERELIVEHFEELRRHFRGMKYMFPQLLESYDKELKAIGHISESAYKKRLEEFSSDLGKELTGLTQWIDNGLLLIEEILKKRVIFQLKEQKEKLKTIIEHITSVLVKSQREAFELVKTEKEWKRQLEAIKRPIHKIQVIGRLSNGWSLSSIRNVILELGGAIEQNPGGTHPYTIKFPNHRSIPLAESTPPFALVREVSSATGVENKIIIVSFSRGELVAA